VSAARRQRLSQPLTPKIVAQHTVQPQIFMPVASIFGIADHCRSSDQILTRKGVVPNKLSGRSLPSLSLRLSFGLRTDGVHGSARTINTYKFSTFKNSYLNTVLPTLATNPNLRLRSVPTGPVNLNCEAGAGTVVGSMSMDTRRHSYRT
jgi:hypothetical protein